MLDDLCTPDWAKTLEPLCKGCGEGTIEIPLSRQPTLANAPIEVRIDGALIDPIDSRGASTWTFDSETNSITIPRFLGPGPGQAMTITYQVACTE